MPGPKIYLYAEALTKIRQLTLHASLQTDKNEQTRILISSDKKVITALHDGESSSIYLPTQISGTANVTFPTERKTEISARLQIDDVNEARPTPEPTTGIEVPWSADELATTASLQCKACNATILSAGKVETWKDLPSEHWEDLMDLWFCHKPHEHHSADTHAAEAKGFSATSRVVARPTVGLVGIDSFLLSQSDCANLQEIDPSSTAPVSVLQCAACRATIGSRREHDAECRLYKSRLAIVPGPDQAAESYTPSVFVSAQLLSLIENSVGRKVVVYHRCPPESKSESRGLLLWIFNPDIYYSSSKRGPTAHRAMKVFYKYITDPEAFLDAHGQTHEDLVLLAEDFSDLCQVVEESTTILPLTARTFQDWDVGLVDRWEKSASGTLIMDGNPLNQKVDSGFELFKLPAGFQELYV